VVEPFIYQLPLLGLDRRPSASPGVVPMFGTPATRSNTTADTMVPTTMTVFRSSFFSVIISLIPILDFSISGQERRRRSASIIARHQLNRYGGRHDVSIRLQNSPVLKCNARIMGGRELTVCKFRRNAIYTLRSTKDS
jgi:hypothetical protein